MEKTEAIFFIKTHYEQVLSFFRIAVKYFDLFW